MIAPGNKDVGWLDVAVNDAFGMRSVKGVGNLDSQFQNLFNGQCLACNKMLESVSLEHLHCDERSPIALIDLINRADIGMIQCGCRPRFAPEPFQCLRIVCYFVWQEL